MIRRRIPNVDDTEIHQLVWQELIPLTKNNYMWMEFSLNDLKERLRGQNTYVVVENGQFCGFVTCSIKENKLFIDMLAVDPSKQGRGYGKKLMREGEHFGRRHGCREVTLMVDDVNTNGQQFYLALGYTFSHAVPQVYCHVMHKKL